MSSKLKGTLGCFLGHYAAWEAHYQSHDSHALILEDDCILRIDLPRRSSAFLLPENYDVCFLTTGLGDSEDEHERQRQDVSYEPLGTTIKKLSPRLMAPGAYGYFLSRRGAERLLANVNEDGFYGDVDWRMISYCLPRSALEDYPARSFCSAALAGHFRVIADRQELIGYRCSPGLVTPGRLGSARNQYDQTMHAHTTIEEEGSA